ncbi:MAG TPA: GntR family transcriptional regulator [Casimicrobiaceae bacterium]|nr:GntR family transcriptional regulator [Casimicrobiaceae bacterium]
MPKIRTGPVRGDGAGALLPALRERIARHALPPGAKLLENDLAREFGVSRAKVRDAFGVLEQRGLIQRIPNRGAVVARLDLSQVFEIYAVREMLEGLCVRLAVERTRPSSWQDLVQVFGRPMETIVKRGEFEKYIANLDELRSRTLEAAGNGVLADMLDSINDKTREIQRRIIILPGRAAEGLEQHRAVLAAMRKGDAAGAEELRRANIRSSRAYLERYQSFVL